MVGKYIKELNASKSQGPDNLQPKLPLETLDEIKNPLTEIFNKSAQQGPVSNDWKPANIIPNFSDQFRKITKRYIKSGYNMDIMRQSACLVVNPIMVYRFGFLCNCTMVGHAPDSMMTLT